MIPTLQLGGLGRRRVGGGSTGATYLDDLAVQARMALSLKRRIGDASASLRVRRSTDDAEMDIGFSGDALDTATLLAFVGAGSGYIRTWYDQYVNAHHAQQPTNSLQPRIVNAGTYDGKIVFSGAQCLKVSSLVLGTPQVGVYARYRHSSAAGTQVVLEMTTVGSSNTGTFLVYVNSGNTFLDSYNSAGSTNRARSTDVATLMSLQDYLMDRDIVGSGELALFKDGAARSSTEPVSHEQTGTYLTNDLYIGARAASSLFASMEMQDLIIYNQDTAGIRAGVEAAIP